MLEIRKSEFKPENYSRLNLLEAAKNGNETYEFVGPCPRCGGTGIYEYTTLDEHRCWECKGFKKTLQKIKVLTDANWDARDAKRKEEARKWNEKKAKMDAAQIKANTEKGYKLVDFKLAGWFLGRPEDREYNSGKYYLIVKETKKAVCISFMDRLDSGVTYEEWFPKKAIIK